MVNKKQGEYNINISLSAIAQYLAWCLRQRETQHSTVSVRELHTPFRVYMQHSVIYICYSDYFTDRSYKPVFVLQYLPTNNDFTYKSLSKFWFTWHECNWRLCVSLDVVCSPLQQPYILECVSSMSWLVQWPVWITFALHDNSFHPCGKRAWGRACDPSDLEKMLGVNVWILFYQSLFLTCKQSRKTKQNTKRNPQSNLGWLYRINQHTNQNSGLMQNPVIYGLSSGPRNKGESWHKIKDGKTGCLFSRTLWCAALGERHSVWLMVMTVAC